ncbi:MAG: hypothetical protein K2G67_05970 [Muribaculaceae bacterium]|nr:hypothetical protein [Muribaculaceae bacterium]
MENKNRHLTTVPSGFSWVRVKDVANFYRPGIEKQVLWYLIISVICAIVTLLPLNRYAQFGLYSIIWTMLPLMFELAPCMLSKSGDTRIIERLIPASPGEKYAFRLLYFLIVIPVASQLLPRLAMYLYLQIPTIQTEDMKALIETSLSSSPRVWLINIFTAVSAALTCLYVVTRARTNRTLKGILSVFAVQIGAGILGAIWGFTNAFKLGIEDGMAGEGIRNSSEVTHELMEELASSPYMAFVMILLAAYTILMLVLNYRILYKRNL